MARIFLGKSTMFTVMLPGTRCHVPCSMLSKTSKIGPIQFFLFKSHLYCLLLVPRIPKRCELFLYDQWLESCSKIIQSFSVHLLYLGDLLPVLHAAAVDRDEHGGHEEKDEHATNVENVDTETLNFF